MRKVEKLLPSLKDKNTCVVNIIKLKQALKHGLKLKKVHNVIKFEQSYWIKPYMMLNTRLKTATNIKFEKDFHKTMENICNRKDTKLVTSQEIYAKHVIKPNLKGGHPFSRELFVTDTGKIEIKMNKLVYLGQAILDLSKMLMYKFHYN